MENHDPLKEIVNPQQYKIIKDLVHNPDATVDNALQQIVDLILTAHATPNEEEYFTPGNVDYYTSLGLMNLVQDLEPTKHRKLVGFLYGLQKRTARDPSSGEPFRTQGNIFWTDLPSCGYTELEIWQEFGGGYKDPGTLKLRNEQRQRWLKLTAFIAQFNQAADVSYEPPLDQGYNIHPLDRPHRAVQTFQLVLENDDAPMHRLAKTATMEATCIWSIYSADRLWKMSDMVGLTVWTLDWGWGVRVSRIGG